MIELITGDVLFGETVQHYGELPLLLKIFLVCVLVFGTAAILMTALSLLSFVASGAPFIATSKRLTRKIAALAGIRPGERVYDLGCGDGRFLIEAAKQYGAIAVGIEISPMVCALARFTAWLKRADVDIRCANFNVCNFTDADVIFCYLVSDQMAALGEKMTGLKKGCRILSRRFELPGHEPSERVQVKKLFGYETVFIYRIGNRLPDSIPEG